MKRLKTWLCFVLLALSLFHSGFSYISKPDCRMIEDAYPVLESDNIKGFPQGFRNDTVLNISGSGQFTPPQLINIINEINQKDIIIVDLRQETHGFINDYAVGLFSPDEIINRGCSSKQVLAFETKYFTSLQPGTQVNIYSRKKALKETPTVLKTFTEEQLAKENNAGYVLFAVQDGSIPAPEVTDEFVKFIADKPESTHLYFHCRAGRGRTTTFMAMYQIMKDKNNMSLEDIFEYQESIGGINLMKRHSRAEFLKDFYSYVKENKAQGYKARYSEWKKS